MTEATANQEETAIAKKEETAVGLPQKGRGFEEPSAREDFIMPRAKLLQFQSPEVIEKPDTFQAGKIINSVTKEFLPSEFIPIFKFTEWIRFNPRDENRPGFNREFAPGDIIWRSSDPYNEKVQKEGQFGPNGERPLATKFLNFLAYFPGATMPIVVSFSNTSFKAGRQLLTLAQFSGGDMFSKIYRLESRKESNNLGTYFVLTVELAGVPSERDSKIAEKWWNEYHAKSVEVHTETPDATEQPPF